MKSSAELTDVETQKQQDLADLIKARVNNLRPKLLDMSRRNPLISPKLGPRSNSHIQVVDELPEVLFNNLASQEKMRFRSLPSLEEDPKDEESVEFQDAVSQERGIDEQYQLDLEALSQNTEEDLEAYRVLERDLKDRVRAKRQMPARQTKNETSLSQHAKNHGISSSYELPVASETHEDGRHTDKDIQTLLLPDALERKLSKIISSCNSWTQETGVHVLYSAYGFLEWKDLKSGENIFAPLILLPVAIEKLRSVNGTEFWVSGQEAEGELNTVLQEKLKQDFGIKMPALDGANLENFFAEMASLSPTNVSWKVKRQVVFGVFPSARIAMYHDLDTANHSFETNGAIASLLAGSGSTGVTLFGDEYSTDDPEIEKKAPWLVMDADSSQFSTLVDIVDGKHLAVEGPPGTGKSQTIVNAIAAALHKKKKVLFVAEKSAALNVVKARLEQVGLGHFVLPLQADKASREKVFASINSRLNMGHVSSSKELEPKILRFKEARGEIQSYIDVLTSDVGTTGLKVYEAMGKAIKTNDTLANMPEAILKLPISEIEHFTNLRIEKGLILANSLSEAWNRTQNCGPLWNSATVVDMDKFTAEQICDAALNLAEKAVAQKEAANLAAEAGATNIGDNQTIEDLLKKMHVLDKISHSANLDAACTFRAEDLSELSDFLLHCKTYHAKHSDLANAVGNREELPSPEAIAKAINLALLTNENSENLDGYMQKRKQHISTKSELQLRIDALKSFIEANPGAENWPVQNFATISSLAGSFDKRVLKLRAQVELDEIDSAQIKAISKKGKTLIRNREELSSRLYVNRANGDADELLKHVTALKTSNVLSLFDSKFQNAKRFYLSICKASKFTKHQAVNELNDLVEWKQELESFLNDKRARAVFGKNLDLDCEFEAFEELGNFIDEVFEKYPDESQASIRDFLLSQPREKLLSCPRIDSANFGETNFVELTEKAASLQQKLEPLSALQEQLDTHLKQFPKIRTLNLDELERLTTDIQRVLDSADTLENDSNSRSLLGSYFKGTQTDFATLLPAVELSKSINETQAQIPNIAKLVADKKLPILNSTLKRLLDASSQVEVALIQLSRISGIPEQQLNQLIARENAAETLRAAAADSDGLFAFADFRTALRDLNEAGLGWIAEQLVAADLPLTNLAEIVQATIYRCLTKRIYSEHNRILSKYSGRKLDECRAAVAQYDREIIKLSREVLKAKLRYSSKPPEGVSQGRKSEFTEMSLIKNELGKKRGFISVRDLTKRAQTALLELKPCWMMSPLAVAQYLQQGDCPFDLVIIDEASQMPPENALGALVRAKQAMIVGDTNQLPPSNFFNTAFNDDETDEDETVLEESVLELANSAFRPARRLKWHYRSKHSSLINFSNQMVYGGDLVVFPGPSEEKSDFGVSLEQVEGYYKTGLNEREADAMIAAIQKFMKASPEKSLGVVTMNRKQRDLLQERLEHALTQNNVAASYIDNWKKKNDGLEEFFIKNLENVQGDERDVIFIGTVYGPPEPGAKTANRFGPINGLAGKRRLNVLFSRAKMKIVTFSSMNPTDITAEEERNAGAFMLKKWLEYSGTGGFLGGVTTGKASDSDFEDYVIQQLKSIGCEAIPQVGAAGYFIDIGVKHPAWPYGYILGVECDGAAYHSSKSARDRDRLRQEVLEGLGWRFHRIWSTDWFTDPKRQGDVLRDVISKRVKELTETGKC